MTIEQHLRNILGQHVEPGLTKLELFTMAAMHAACSSDAVMRAIARLSDGNGAAGGVEEVARFSVDIAKATIKRLSEE